MDGIKGNYILFEGVQGPLLEEFRETVAPLAAKTLIFQKMAKRTRVVGNASLKSKKFIISP